MPHSFDPIPSDVILPDKVDAVVVGAGVIGVTAALELARAGLSVALIEKGFVAAEQSSRNWGWVRQQGRDRREIPLIVESLRLWEQWQAESPVDLGFRRTGLVSLTRTQAELDRWRRWAERGRAGGIVVDELTAADAEAALPSRGAPWIGGVRTPTDGRAEPSVAVPALARLARTAGVMIHQETAVRGLDIEAGRAQGVITERGRIAASRVLVAGGAWSSQLLRRHGVWLPQLNLRSTVVRTTPAAELTPRRAADAGILPAASARRGLYAHAARRRKLRPDARRLPLPPAIPPRSFTRAQRYQTAFRLPVLHRSEALAGAPARRCLAVRGGARFRSRARSARFGEGARRLQGRSPGGRRRRNRRSLGRPHRRDARRRSGHREGRGSRGLDGRHWLLWPRLWNWSRRWAARCRSRAWRRAYRRPAPVPTVALQRRQPAVPRPRRDLTRDRPRARLESGADSPLASDRILVSKVHRLILVFNMTSQPVKLLAAAVARRAALSSRNHREVPPDLIRTERQEFASFAEIDPLGARLFPHA